MKQKMLKGLLLLSLVCVTVLILKLNQDLKSNQESIFNLESKIESKSSEISELETIIYDKDNELTDRENEINKLGNYIEEKNNEITQLRTTINSMNRSKKTNDISRGSSYQGSQQSFTVEATAYTAYCKGCSGTTRTGVNLRKNPNLKVIAVDPNIIPLGSTVEVTSSEYPSINGIYMAEDTGGDIKGGRIDIFIPTKESALKFGRRSVDIKILKKGR